MTAADYPGRTWHVHDSDGLAHAIDAADDTDAILVDAPGGVWVPLGTQGRAVRVYRGALTVHAGRVIAIPVLDVHEISESELLLVDGESGGSRRSRRTARPDPG